MARLYQNDKNQTIIEIDNRQDCFFCRGGKDNMFANSVRQFFGLSGDSPNNTCQACQEQTQPIPLNFWEQCHKYRETIIQLLRSSWQLSIFPIKSDSLLNQNLYGVGLNDLIQCLVNTINTLEQKVKEEVPMEQCFACRGLGFKSEYPIYGSLRYNPCPTCQGNKQVSRVRLFSHQFEQIKNSIWGVIAPYSETEQKLLYSPVEWEWKYHEERGDWDLYEIVKVFCDSARDAESRIKDNIEESVEAQLKIGQLELDITNLNLSKDILEAEKNEQIEQLRKEIEALNQTITLLEKAPEDLLDAQLDWNQCQYPEYFAELEQRKGSIEISDFIQLLDRKISRFKRQIAKRPTRQAYKNIQLINLELNQTNQQLEKDLAKSEKQIAQENISNNSLKTKREKDLAKYKKQTKNVKNLVKSKQQLELEAKNRKEELLAEIDALQTDKAKLNEDYLQAQAERDNADKALTAEQTKVATLTNDLTSIRQALNCASQEEILTKIAQLMKKPDGMVIAQKEQKAEREKAQLSQELQGFRQKLSQTNEAKSLVIKQLKETKIVLTIGGSVIGMLLLGVGLKVFIYKAQKKREEML